MGKDDFRLDIQGLRAVASLLVAVFHLWVGRVSGGVDVFFVVSGYLITRTLTKHLDTHGAIRFLDFWSRLIRRLFPAAFTVLAFGILGTYLVVSPVQWRTIHREVVASALYYENWQLAFAAVDYLDRENPASPLQHYWALAVQGQFYVVWPFLFALGAWLSARLRAPRIVVLRAVVAIVFATSFAYSLYSTALDQPFAYFDTRARLWEFALGAGVALVPRRELPTTIELLVSWVGLLLIVSCGALLKVSSLFPGYAALWPACAALCILLAGSKNASSMSASRLLSSRPLVVFGEISYAFYLWHWPLFVFSQNILGRAKLSLLYGGGVMILSGVLAVLTTYGVEAKTRSRGSGARYGTLGFAFAWLLPLLAGASVWHLKIKNAETIDQEPLAADRYPGAMALANPKLTFPVMPPRPHIVGLKNDLPKVYGDGCHQSQKGTKLLRCEYGVKDSKTVVALVGGSHAAQWLPALEPIAEELSWKIVSMTKASCLFRTRSRRESPCDIWNQSLMEELLSLRPSYVFTTSTRAHKREIITSSVKSAWKRLTSEGISVLAIRDTPWMDEDLSVCVDKKGRDSVECTRLRSDLLSTESPTSSVHIPGVYFLDLNDFVCDKTTCRPVVGNVLVYRDRHHLSATYARTLAPLLKQEIVDILDL